MSFREKSAWITLVTVLLCFGAYFGPIVAGRISGHGPVIHLFAHSVIALVVLQCALTFWAARTTPKDGRAPRDEREAQIIARSHTSATTCSWSRWPAWSCPCASDIAGGPAELRAVRHRAGGAGRRGRQIVMFRRGF
jgi:hypothetical protein